MVLRRNAIETPNLGVSTFEFILLGKFGNFFCVQIFLTIFLVVYFGWHKRKILKKHCPLKKQTHVFFDIFEQRKTVELLLFWNKQKVSKKLKELNGS